MTGHEYVPGALYDPGHEDPCCEVCKGYATAPQHRPQGRPEEVARFTAALVAAQPAMQRALRGAVSALQRFVEAFAPLAPYVREVEALQARRIAHGGNAADARLYPYEWLSAQCAGWLHESCPSPEHDLSCSCRCHRRSK